MRQMNRIVFATAVFAACAALGGDDDDLGGDIVVWPKDPGRFLFVNAQKKVADEVLARPVSSVSADFGIDVRKVEGAAPDLHAVPETLRKLGAKGALWIVDDPSLPIALVAAEDGWGVLNMAPLTKDSPDSEKLGKRVAKFIYRTFANINGIGDSSMMPACVMKQAVGVEGVDNLVCATYSPEACSKIGCYLKMAGYKRCNRGTYYDACEEGWAPAPTNAVQKAIWDKVHALPTAPLKIKPEAKKVAE